MAMRITFLAVPVEDLEVLGQAAERRHYASRDAIRRLGNRVSGHGGKTMSFCIAAFGYNA